MTKPRVSAVLVVALLAAMTPTSAWAHPLGIGIFVGVVLIWLYVPICIAMTAVALPGQRIWTLVGTASFFPLSYFFLKAIQDWIMRNRNPSAQDDARWYLLFLQLGIWGFLFFRALKVRLQTKSGAPDSAI